LFSLHLYQLSVRLAIDSISGRFDCVGTLAGCVLLSVYEMMTVHYTDWRRHLQGCASIYKHNEWNGSTGGLISASFWNYAIIGMGLRSKIFETSSQNLQMSGPPSVPTPTLSYLPICGSPMQTKSWRDPMLTENSMLNWLHGCWHGR
jgi:hypothetical protein